ncbi:MAG: purine-nucleoside phosphorylase [Myxococcota bacterium]
MHPEQGPVADVARRLEQTFGPAPHTAVVLGSGLGDLVARMSGVVRAPYRELGLPESTVVGHASQLVYGRLADRPLAVLSGRVHVYEGREPAEAVRYVRALHAWGVRALVLTNSVGGISPGFDPGQLVIVTDHLNFQGRNPLVGPAYGERFPDLSRAYDPGLREVLAGAAASTGIPVLEGVLAAMLGPSYETPAEIRMLATLGADIVGMSTVPEVIAAAEIGLRCAVLSLVSNRAAGLAGHPLTHDEVTGSAHQAGDRLATLLAAAILAIHPSHDGEER